MMYFYQEPFQWFASSMQLVFERLFDSVTVFLTFPVFRYSSRPIFLCIVVFVLQCKWDHFLHLPTSWYPFWCVYQSVNFEVLFKSSPCILCKALSIPKNSRISRSVFCDAARILTWIPSIKDESSSSGILSISKSVGNSVLFTCSTKRSF